MFYEFSSNTDYAVGLWPAIWEIETLVYGVLMEYGASLERFSHENLFNLIKKCLDESGFPPDALPYVPPTEWVDRFLHELTSEVAGFVSRNLNVLKGNDRPQEMRLMPNSTFKERLRESTEFRQYVEYRRSARDTR